MKYIIACILLCLSLFATAQPKMIDLGVSLKLPLNNADIYPDSTFNVDAVVTNNGPDSLPSNARVQYVLLSHTGSAYVIDGQINFYIKNKLLKMGDTAHATLKAKLKYTFSADSTLKVCIKVNPLPPLPPVTMTIADANAANDTSCVMLKFHSKASNVARLSPVLPVWVYPNPVRDEVCLKFTPPNTGTVDLKVYAMDGRVVIATTVDRVGANEQTIRLDTRQLQNGVFYYELHTADGIAKGKFVIAK